MMRFRAMAATVAAAAAITAVILGSVGAQQTGEEGIRRGFAAADANSDGFVDVDEFVANTIYLFKQTDTDHDGYLSAQEWRAAERGHPRERFRSVDRDADGRISLGEAVAAKMIEFFDTDRNRDGAISVEELLAYERSLAPVKAGK